MSTFALNFNKNFEMREYKVGWIEIWMLAAILVCSLPLTLVSCSDDSESYQEVTGEDNFQCQAISNQRSAKILPCRSLCSEI